MVAPAENELAGDEIVITRVFDAPRELVFAAWTVPEHLARWFGPRGVEIRIHALHPAPGGDIHFTHRFGGGESLFAKGHFREVVGNARLVFTLSFVDADGQPDRHPLFPDWPVGAVITTTVGFEDATGGTKVTIRQSVSPASAASNETVKTERSLARQGWSESLDRLSETLRSSP